MIETEPLPKSLEELLESVGPAKTKIYRMVRRILDDLEEVAPWDTLYYPPEEPQEFIKLEIELLEVIDSIPGRVRELAASLEEEAGEADAELVGDAEFFFEGIHGNVTPDIAKLRSKVKAMSVTAGSISLSADERAFTCEITADLKGKYCSSIMGAAATLIAGERWRGVEIEPILFPEKAEEFERNELLVETLSDVIENITNLLEDVPLADLVARWDQGKRVDQYVLTPLYSLLGNIGKLMKEKSRRALYSGDYHQIQKREQLLSTRINELTSLHNMTWAAEEGATPATADGGSPFPAMKQKATELAAILDVNILRRIIGEKYVKDLLVIVTIEKEREDAEMRRGLGIRAGVDTRGAAKPSAMRKSLPENLHSLIPLLYDDDLQNFLGLLFGAVMKRASLALQRERQAAEGAPAADKGAGDFGVMLGAELGAEISDRADEEADATFQGTAAKAPAEEEGGGEAGPAGDLDDLLSSEDASLGFGAGSEMEPVLASVDATEETPLLQIPDLEVGLEMPGGPAPSFDMAALEMAELEMPGVEPPPAAGSPDASSSGGESSDGETVPNGGAASVVEELPPMEEFPSYEPEPEPVAAGPSLEEKLEAVGRLDELLRALLSRDNAHRKSFELVSRLLEQGRSVPPSMMQSVHPYLYDILNMLIPQLNDMDDVPEIDSDPSSHLFEDCTYLCDRNLSPDQIKGQVPATMERINRLLEGLQATSGSLLQNLRRQA